MAMEMLATIKQTIFSNCLQYKMSNYKCTLSTCVFLTSNMLSMGLTAIDKDKFSWDEKNHNGITFLKLEITFCPLTRNQELFYVALCLQDKNREDGGMNTLS